MANQEMPEPTRSGPLTLSRPVKSDTLLHVPEPSSGDTDLSQPIHLLEIGPSIDSPEPPYTVFSYWEKVGIIILVSFLAMISPLSSTVFLPAIPSIAKDMGVSISLINLTVTTYLVRNLLQSPPIFTSYDRFFKELHPRLSETFQTLMGVDQHT